MTKSKILNILQFMELLEKQGAICRIGKGRLESVIDIDHIEPGHFAAFYAVPSPSGVQVVELAEYFATEGTAWHALQDEDSPAHPAKPCEEWMKEQYLTDINARVERLSI